MKIIEVPLSLSLLAPILGKRISSIDLSFLSILFSFFFQFSIFEDPLMYSKYGEWIIFAEDLGERLDEISKEERKKEKKLAKNVKFPNRINFYPTEATQRSRRWETCSKWYEICKQIATVTKLIPWRFFEKRFLKKEKTKSTINFQNPLYSIFYLNTSRGRFVTFISRLEFDCISNRGLVSPRVVH